ncbi:MAG TPA: M20/M25/M40 family metallo-hydrolase [Gemmatimonadaceae bacterium]|nr:M20/M25/M40 family metallo-hydrolase [Gemmatimonadaceae bacterium]
MPKAIVKPRLALVAVIVCALPMCAQDRGHDAGIANAALAGDVSVITEALLRRHVSVIADDSMRGRATPSAGLDKTASYIAAQFERLKLKGGGDRGTFIQTYPVPTRPDVRAPNVVAILEGEDPALKGQYVVFSAHMDHVGVGAPVGGDSIYNGADDNASGTAAVLALAEAFARAAQRPRRSIIFLTVSGEEHGLWGSAYFASHPPVPLDSMVAALNIDMIGRNWRDTLVAIGREHSDLGATVDSVAARHRELRISTIDDPWPNEQFYFRSDHYNFAKRGVPALFFFSGTHADYHGPDDEVDRIDFEKETRIVQLLYQVGVELANAAKRPVWNPESYRRIVGQR